QWADRYGLDEISVTDGNARIQISRNGVVAAPAPVQTVASTSHSVEEALPKEPVVLVSDNFKKIVSPMVGTFYRAPNPDAAPFVKEGDSISAGDTVCIVEAMKIMNQIKAPFDGIVRKILVKNAETVMKDQTLFEIEPA